MTGKWFSLVLFVSLGTLTCTNSEARPLQAIEYGSGLKAFCSASKSTDDRYAMCFAFVRAVLEVIGNNQIYGQRVCVFPPYVNVRQAVEVTLIWLRHYPEAHIEPASLVVAKALAATYSCNKR